MAARALLSKQFANLATKHTTSRKKKFQTATLGFSKLVQHPGVELTKIRLQAKPGDVKDQPFATPVNERLHIRVTAGEMEGCFWFRKSLSTGKVLDCLALQFTMVSAVEQPLQLSHVNGSVLRNEALIVDEVQDGDIILLGPAGLESVVSVDD